MVILLLGILRITYLRIYIALLEMLRVKFSLSTLCGQIKYSLFVSKAVGQSLHPTALTLLFLFRGAFCYVKVKYFQNRNLK